MYTLATFVVLVYRYGQDGVPPRFQGIGVRVDDTVLILKDPVPTVSQSPATTLHHPMLAKALSGGITTARDRQSIIHSDLRSAKPNGCTH